MHAPTAVQKSTGLPDRLSDAEFHRRHEALRSKLMQHGLDAVVVFGTFQGWQNVLYLANHWDLVSCYLVFPTQSEPVLFTGVYPHLASVRDNAVVTDIRFGGTKSIEFISEILEQRGLRTVGLIEPDSYRLPGIPHKDMRRLRGLSPKVEFVAITAMLEEIRRIKSAEEIEILRRCAALTDDCLSRVIDAVRPGITDKDLAHEIASAPGETIAVLVGSTSMQDPQVPAPAIRPISRELKLGDVVLIELSKGGAGYAGQVHGMITLGAATDQYLEMSELANEAYRSVVAVLRRGCTPLEVADAAAMIRRAGFTIGNPLVHGFGMGIEPGLHVGMPGAGAYWPAADFTFPEGATLTIEPNPCNQEMTMGSTSGGLVLVGAAGCEELQKHAGQPLIQKPV
jgi:Xaa-Pro aminopeptidase